MCMQSRKFFSLPGTLVPSQSDSRTGFRARNCTGRGWRTSKFRKIRKILDNRRTILWFWNGISLSRTLPWTLPRVWALSECDNRRSTTWFWTGLCQGILCVCQLSHRAQQRWSMWPLPMAICLPCEESEDSSILMSDTISSTTCPTRMLSCDSSFYEIALCMLFDLSISLCETREKLWGNNYR